MKYIRKGTLEMTQDGLVGAEFMKTQVFDVEFASDDQEIDTRNGKILLTKGNYIMTDHQGYKMGITPQDLENQYDKAD